MKDLSSSKQPALKGAPPISPQPTSRRSVSATTTSLQLTRSPSRRYLRKPSARSIASLAAATALAESKTPFVVVDSDDSGERKVRFAPPSQRVRCRRTLHHNDMTPEEIEAYWLRPEDETERRTIAQEAAQRFGKRSSNKHLISHLNDQFEDIKHLAKMFKNSTRKVFENPTLFTEETLEEWVFECEEHRGLEHLCSPFLGEKIVEKTQRYIHKVTTMQYGNDKLARHAQALSLPDRLWARAMAEADALAAQEEDDE